jgi:hypothetical protein
VGTSRFVAKFMAQIAVSELARPHPLLRVAPVTSAKLTPPIPAKRGDERQIVARVRGHPPVKRPER